MQKAINQYYEYHNNMRNKTKTIMLVKQRGGGLCAVYRITEQWYGESYARVWETPRKREIPTVKREIPSGKRGKQ